MSQSLDDEQLQVGVGRTDITPEMGIQLAGDIGRKRPAELVIDRIYANALVAEQGGKRFCILSLDLLAIDNDWSDEIRGRVAERFGFDREAVMLHVVQNHATPAIGHFMCRPTPYLPEELAWLRGGDDRYNEFAVERIIEAVRLAVGSMETVCMGAASGMEVRVAFNRRFVLRDGTARMGIPPGEPHKVLRREGPMDPELGVVCFTTKSLRKVAMLLHHTSHPCHGYPHRFVIGDWPGQWAQMTCGLYPDRPTALVLNGCCGNVIHHDSLNPHREDTSERMGRLLTETTAEVMKRMRYQENVHLDYRVKRIEIPYRELTESRVAEARKLLEEHPEPMWRDESKTAVEWPWWYAVSILDLHEYFKTHDHHDYEIQAFRLGDVAIVALTGEPFVEGQLRIKLESPAPLTYVAHMSNGYVGYVPTREALERGGYETDTCNGSKLAPEALDMIVDSTVELLREMWEAEGGSEE